MIVLESILLATWNAILDGKFALRASITGQIFLEDVFVTKDKILPEVQYSLKDKFNPNDLDCIAVGQISDNTKKREFNKHYN